MKSLVLVFVLLSILPSAVPAQLATQGTVLDHFSGDWVMTGTIAGGEVVHDVDADWVLAGHYLRFHDFSREREKGGERAYEATVFIGWDAQTERFVCLWLDVTGGEGLASGVLGYAAPVGDTIPFVFGEGESRIHNTFVYHRGAEAGIGRRRDSELMSVVDLFAGLNKLLDGLQVEPDEKPWYG